MKFDIVIVGGGIVGLTLANLLRELPLRIAIIDPQTPTLQWDSHHYDLRVSAITRASQQVFATIAAWPAMQKRRVSAYEHMYVWNSVNENHIDFHASDIAEPNLGHIIENCVIQQALWETLQPSANVKWITTTLQSYNVLTDHVTLDCDNNQQPITAKLVVGADGGCSRVRQMTDIAVTHWSYQQHAIVATITTEKPHQQTAWQVFLPTGPLAFLPLADPHTCSIVWSLNEKEIDTIYQLEDHAFKQTLVKAFANKLGSITTVSQRQRFPLHMQHAKHYIKSCVALLGDAAHTIHPLAGQGANLGIADATVLANVLTKAYQTQRDVGDYYVLRRYERQRKGANLTMIALMEGFKRGFSHDVKPIHHLLGAGLQWVNRLPIAKTYMAKYALGI